MTPADLITAINALPPRERFALVSKIGKGWTHDSNAPKSFTRHEFSNEWEGTAFPAFVHKMWRGRWQASIHSRALGGFDTADEACSACDKVLIEAGWILLGQIQR